MFVPKDAEDLSLGKDERNSRIVLATRIGRGVVAVEVPVLVKEISFRGTISLQLKTMPSFPYIKTASVSFYEHPKIDFVLKPLKGVDLMDMPGLSNFLDLLVNQVVGMLFVQPNIFTLDLDAIMNGAVSTTESATAILCIKIYEAKELKNVEVLRNSDPYTEIRVGGRPAAKTRVIDNNLNPYWNETFYVLIQSLSDTLEFAVLDKDMLRDRTLGTFVCPMAEFDLEANPKLEDVWKPLRSSREVRDGKEAKQKGEIRFDISYFPLSVDDPTKNLIVDPEAAKSPAGVLRINVHQAKELDTSKSRTGQYSPFVEIRYNNIVVRKTKVKKRTNNPTWEDSYEFFIRDCQKDRLKFFVKDQRDLMNDQELGECEIMCKELVKMLRSTNATKREWWNLRNASSGKIRLTFRWTPVLLDHAAPPLTVGGRQSLIPAIGVVRVKLIEADGLRNTEAVGLSDPYVIVTYAGKPRASTSVVDNSLSPMWNENHYILIHDTALRGKLKMEIFDYNNMQKDKLMGTAYFDLKTLAQAKLSDDQSTEGHRYRTLDMWLSVNVDNGRKEAGRLHVEITFYEALEIFSELDAEASADISPKSSTKTIFPASDSVKSTPKLAKLDDPKITPKMTKLEDVVVPTKSEKTILDYMEDYNCGLLRFALRDVVLNEEALSRSGYDSKKGPQAYFEFLDIADSMTSNDVEHLSETNTINKAMDKSRMSNAPGLRRRGSRDVGKLLSTLSDPQLDASSTSVTSSKTSANISLLHRTIASKKGFESVYDEEMEFLVTDLNSARLLIVCKNHEVANIVPGVIKPGLGKDKEEAANKDTSKGAVRHPILGRMSFHVKSLLKRCAEMAKRNEESIPLVLSEWIDIQALPQENTKKSTSSLAPEIVGRFRLDMTFVPVPLDQAVLYDDLELAASDAGQLTVELVEALDLPGVDKSGTSDPYCLCRLNSNRVYKSKVMKKNNLHPVWNEKFTTSIASRKSSRFVVEICDWNQFDERELLGLIWFNGASFEIDGTLDQACDIFDENEKQVFGSDGKPSKIHLKLNFSPDNKNIQLRMKRPVKRASIVKVVGGMMGDKTIGAMASVGVAARKFANVRKSMDSIASIGSGTSPKLSMKDLSVLVKSPVDVRPSFAVVADMKIGGEQDKTPRPEKKDDSGVKPEVAARKSELASSPKVSRNEACTFHHDNFIPHDVDSAIGILTIDIVEAKELKPADSNGLSDPYVKLRQMDGAKQRDKTLFKTKTMKKNLNPVWNESFVYPRAVNANETLALMLNVKDHNVLGNGVDLGEYSLDVWKWLKIPKEGVPLKENSPVVVDLWTEPGELVGGMKGVVHVVLRFQPIKDASMFVPAPVRPSLSTSSSSQSLPLAEGMKDFANKLRFKL